ncbi:hypothetical protein A4G19_03830 [Pasteurellaceae bacterium Macca]|nr:hypothetical protein [Pasteurellaceae bacterium Macca]
MFKTRTKAEMIADFALIIEAISPELDNHQDYLLPTLGLCRTTLRYVRFIPEGNVDAVMGFYPYDGQAECYAFQSAVWEFERNQ